jgi:hypothetical protein
LQQQKDSMTKQDLCLDAIQFKIGRTAAWRRCLAAKFPNDQRNERATERLETFAQDDGDGVAPDTLAALAICAHAPAMTETVNETA